MIEKIKHYLLEKNLDALRTKVAKGTISASQVGDYARMALYKERGYW